MSPDKFLVDIPGPKLGGAGGYIQLVPGSGNPARSENDPVALPVSERVRQVATGDKGEFLTDARVADTHVRVLTTPLVPGWALQVARPLTEVDSALARIRKLLFLIMLAGRGRRRRARPGRHAGRARARAPADRDSGARHRRRGI